MAPEAGSRRLKTSVLVCCCLLAACGRGTLDIAVNWDIEPSPPVAGSTTVVRVRIAHADGSAASGARLRLEGHMSHPGMTPVTTTLVERATGNYEGRLLLSMGGDWVFVLSGELADGRRITIERQVPAVRSAG